MARFKGGNLELTSSNKIVHGSNVIVSSGRKGSFSKVQLDIGAEIDEFSIDGTLAGDSDTALPTEKAVKTYVDNLTVTGTSEQDSYQDLLTTSKYQNLTFDDFSDTSLVDTVSTTMNYDQPNTRYTFTSGEILQSENLFDSNSGLSEVTECLIQMIYSDSSSSVSVLELTADGTNWEVATVNTIHTFSNIGTTLKIRYTGGGSGEIKSWGIIYNPSLYDVVEPTGEVTASANLTDDYIIRGDGGVKGVQTSTIKITDDGEMTNTSQPYFNVQPSGDQNNIAVNTEVTILWGTEHVDVGNNFASNTFTAPVTGVYQFNTNIRVQNLDSAASFYRIKIITTQRSYEMIMDPRRFSADVSYWSMDLSVLADMDANDTAYVVISQSGGAQQTDIQVSSGFQGVLIA